MEAFNDRLCRFLKGSSRDVPLTLLNSISNFFLPDLRKIGELRLDRFMFLGTHAVIHTIEGILFDRHGPAATKSYLSSYVDGQEENTMFSLVADTIHELRNDLAHQWISTHAYRYIIDYRRELGWWEDTEGVHINPDRYFKQFIASWEGDGAIWNCHSAMSERKPSN